VGGAPLRIKPKPFDSVTVTFKKQVNMEKVQKVSVTFSAQNLTKF